MDEPTPPVRYTRTADGVSIAYMVWPGQGIPFLRVRVLGAMPMALSATMEDVRLFAGDRPMVWFDWRGTGQSARKVPASIDDLLLDIDAVMSVIDSDEVDVLATNAACFPACTYAASRGERWRSLVLTDPALRVEGSPQGVLIRPGWEADFEGFLASMARAFFLPMSNEELERVVRAWAAAMPIEVFRAFQSIQRKIDLTDTLRALDMHVLIFKVLPRSGADSVAALIPDAVLLERPFGRVGARARNDWNTYIGSKFADPLQAATAGAGSNGLSPREREVLSLLASGKSNTEIATAFCLSIRTVERHTRNIYTKLGVHNRVEAANWAREHGVN
jgi:DNA-binding CsgD family transcriptional regulator